MNIMRLLKAGFAAGMLFVARVGNYQPNQRPKREKSNKTMKTKRFIPTGAAVLPLLAGLALTAALFPAQAQNLFEADWSIFYSGNNIYQFTPDGAKTTFAPHVFQAVGLAFDSSSNLFVANGYVGTITKITPDGTESIFASGLSYPFGLAFNIVSNLFEADMGSGNIYQFTPDGAQSTFASGLNCPCALAVDSAGNLFESDQGSGNIYKFAPNGSQSLFASGFINPNGLAFNRTGDLFLAGEFSGCIYKFTPDGTQSIFASGLNSPSGLAIDDAGDVFVGNEGDGTIYKFTPDGTPSVFATGLNAPNGLAFQRSLGSLTPRILRVPADYPTIQWAINEASYFVADTVLVTNGTYFENLDFNGKAVTVTSVNGPQATIIDGSNAGPVVNFSNGEGVGSVIKGFTIQNGYNWLGSGMTLLGSSPTIIGNIFQNNAEEDGYYGAAIGGNNASPIIERNLFQKNTADDQWLSGVVSFVNDSSPLIADNVFLNNTCRAINMSLPEGNTPIVINNTIVNNSVGIRVDARVDTSSQVYYNNILLDNDVGMDVDFGSVGNYPTWGNNLVFGGQTSYQGIPDQTGIDGNISTNPFFACLPSGDFHLLAGSRCIDVGMNGAPQLPAVDFDGHPRILAGKTNHSAVVDMGAYEFNPASPSTPCLYLNCPSNVVVVAAVGKNSAVVNYPAPDATPGATVTCLPASGSVFPAGTNVVVCTLVYGTNNLTGTFTVTVLVPAYITNQPSVLSVFAGSNATLTVGALGTAPMSYQWSFGGAAIANATNSTLTVSNAQSINEGYYQVTLANDVGIATSRPIILRVLPSKALIVSGPVPVSIPAGSQAVFNVNVIGSAPLTLQWYKDGALLAGAVSSQLVISNAQAANAGTYQLLASNFLGTAVSAGATLTVLPAKPSFVLQPVSVAAVAGSSVAFESLSTGSDDGLNPIRYAWYFQSNRIAGQTSHDLPLSSIAATNQGAYYVVASNSYGTATSAVAQLTVYLPPSLPAGLSNQVVDEGKTIVLNPNATGTPPLAYSWSFNTTQLTNTAAFISLTNITPAQSGYYSVTVTNQYGSIAATGRISVFLPASPVMAWGDDSGGQTDVPTNLDDAVAIAGGDYHSVAIRHDGTLVAWGFDDEGQIDVPTNSLRFVSVASGADHNLAIAEDGSVVAWGRDDSGQTDIPGAVSSALSVAAGNAHSLALLASGIVVVWGDDTYGKTDLPPALTPGGYWEYIPGPYWWDGYWMWVPVNPPPVRAIAAGHNHNLALFYDGTIVGWGDNSFGQASPPSNLTNVVAITAGFLHSAALCSNGTVVVWGDNTFGQTNVPAGLSNVVAIAAGDFHTLALLSNGTVVGWGDDTFGQLDVPFDAVNTAGIASGYYHGLALVPLNSLLQSYLTRDGLLIKWRGTGVLQWAPTPLGPYADVLCQGNCWTNSDMSAPAKFFRLRR
jgi:hypothetical protein